MPRVGLAQQGSRGDAEGEQGAGLQRLHQTHLFDVRGGALFGLHVEGLPADHAGEARRARQAEAELDAHVGARLRRGIGENLERQRLQSVAGEDGGRFAMDDVGRRAPAA